MAKAQNPVVKGKKQDAADRVLSNPSPADKLTQSHG